MAEEEKPERKSWSQKGWLFFLVTGLPPWIVKEDERLEFKIQLTEHQQFLLFWGVTIGVFILMLLVAFLVGPLI